MPARKLMTLTCHLMLRFKCEPDTQSFLPAAASYVAMRESERVPYLSNAPSQIRNIWWFLLNASMSLKW